VLKNVSFDVRRSGVFDARSPFERRTTNRERSSANDERRTTNHERRTTNDERRTSP